MATYLQGITDIIPQVQPWDPNLNFYSSILGTKQQKYNQGWQQVNNIYSSVLNSPMMREDTNAKRDQFFKDIENQIKQLSSVDLSLAQNIDMAGEIFKPFYEDELILKDLGFTKKYQDEMALADRYRKCLDDSCKGKYWKGGVKALQYQAEDFRNADKNSALRASLPEYTPYVNAMEKYSKAIKDMGFSMTYDEIKGGYIVTTKNGPKLQAPLMNFIMSRFGDDPELNDFYNTKSYLMLKENPEQATMMYQAAMMSQGQLNEEDVKKEVESVDLQNKYQKSKADIKKLREEEAGRKQVIEQRLNILQEEKKKGNIIPGSKAEMSFQQLIEAYNNQEISLKNLDSVNKTIRTIDQNLKDLGINAQKEQVQAVIANSMKYGDMMASASIMAFRDFEQKIKKDPYASARYKYSLENSKSYSGEGSNKNGSNALNTISESPLSASLNKGSLTKSNKTYIKKKTSSYLEELKDSGKISKADYEKLNDNLNVGDYNTFKEIVFKTEQLYNNHLLEKEQKQNEIKSVKPLGKDYGDNELIKDIEKAQDSGQNSDYYKAFSKYQHKQKYKASVYVQKANELKNSLNNKYLNAVVTSAKNGNEKALQEILYIGDNVQNLKKSTYFSTLPKGVKEVLNEFPHTKDPSNLTAENLYKLSSIANDGSLLNILGDPAKVNKILFDEDGVYNKKDYNSSNPDMSTMSEEDLKKYNYILNNEVVEFNRRFGKEEEISFYDEWIKENLDIKADLLVAKTLDASYNTLVDNHNKQVKQIVNKLSGKFPLDDSTLSEAEGLSGIIARNLFEFKDGDFARLKSFREIEEELYKTKYRPSFYTTTRDSWGDWDSWREAGSSPLQTLTISELEQSNNDAGSETSARYKPSTVLNLLANSEAYTPYVEPFKDEIYDKDKVWKLANSLSKNYNENPFKILKHNEDKLNLKRVGNKLEISLKPEYKKELGFNDKVIVNFEDVEVNDPLLEAVWDDGVTAYQQIVTEFTKNLSEVISSSDSGLKGKGQFIADTQLFDVPTNTSSDLWGYSKDLIETVLTNNPLKTESELNKDDKKEFGYFLLNEYNSWMEDYTVGQNDKFKPASIEYNPIKGSVYNSEMKITFPSTFIEDVSKKLDLEEKEVKKMTEPYVFNIKNDESKIKKATQYKPLNTIVPNPGDEFTIDSGFGNSNITFQNINGNLYYKVNVPRFNETTNEIVESFESDQLPKDYSLEDFFKNYVPYLYTLEEAKNQILKEINGKTKQQPTE
jgi:hypothetical protein